MSDAAAVRVETAPSWPIAGAAGLADVLLVVPTLNEEQGLPLVLRQARDLGVTTLVLDGGSEDGTREVAARFDVEIVAVGRGKGRGWQDFLAAVPYAKWRYVAMVDGDGSYDLSALPRLLQAGADMAVAIRRHHPGSTSAPRLWGARLLSLLAAALTGRDCPDLLSGFRVIRSESLQQVRLRAHGFGLESELTLEFWRHGFAVVWVPVDYLPRQGTSKLRPLRDGLDILFTILRTRFRRP